MPAPALITQDTVEECARATIVRITDDASYQRAATERATADAARRWWADEHEDARKKTHAAWTSVRDLINKFVKPIDRFIELQDRELVRWRRHKEQQRQAQIAAQAPAKEAASQAFKQAVVEQRMDIAEQREAAGDHAGALEILDAPVPDAPDFPDFVPAAAPEVEAAVDFRKFWHAEVTSFGALVLAAAATVAKENGWVLSYRKARATGDVKLIDLVNEVPLECIEPNEKFLNAQAKFYKAAMADKFPGVKAVEDERPAKARE